MELKKLHVGTVSYGNDSMEEVARLLVGDTLPKSPLATPVTSQRGRREISSRVKDAVFALAVCHNVTPTLDEESGTVQFQASSPDEVAIVQWCGLVGLHLIHRDRHTLKLRLAEGNELSYRILKIFPFTSESKRMGIIVRNDNDEIWFFMKGADTVMQKLVVANDWMEEECANMAREGLRTLVIGRRRLTEDLWTEFEEAFNRINENFQSTFRKLFGGGHGFMRLTDTENSMESGIDVVASPPGKKLQNVLLLSGGEKALTALALLVGIFQYTPSPFCILDEVDAPLDESNIARFTELVRELSVQTQFILITHSKRTMSIAPVLYGVTMQEPGVSKLVSVRFGAA